MRLKALKDVLVKLGGTPDNERTCGEVIEKIADKAGGGGGGGAFIARAVYHDDDDIVFENSFDEIYNHVNNGENVICLLEYNDNYTVLPCVNKNEWDGGKSFEFRGAAEANQYGVSLETIYVNYNVYETDAWNYQYTSGSTDYLKPCEITWHYSGEAQDDYDWDNTESYMNFDEIINDFDNVKFVLKIEQDGEDTQYIQMNGMWYESDTIYLHGTRAQLGAGRVQITDYLVSMFENGDIGAFAKSR